MDTFSIINCQQGRYHSFNCIAIPVEHTGWLSYGLDSKNMFQSFFQGGYQIIKLRHFGNGASINDFYPQINRFLVLYRCLENPYKNRNHESLFDSAVPQNSRIYWGRPSIDQIFYIPPDLYIYFCFSAKTTPSFFAIAFFFSYICLFNCAMLLTWSFDVFLSIGPILFPIFCSWPEETSTFRISQALLLTFVWSLDCIYGNLHSCR